jgi:hypothetical protein
MVGCCDHHNGPAGSVNLRDFFDTMKNCQLLKKGSASLELYS